jgi:hypothetical protein
VPITQHVAGGRRRAAWLALAVLGSAPALVAPAPAAAASISVVRGETSFAVHAGPGPHLSGTAPRLSRAAAPAGADWSVRMAGVTVNDASGSGTGWTLRLQRLDRDPGIVEVTSGPMVSGADNTSAAPRAVTGPQALLAGQTVALAGAAAGAMGRWSFANPPALDGYGTATAVLGLSIASGP